MSDSDDLDLLAAEYVLGTLDAGERATVAARRNREPALAVAITGWEERLAPLIETVPEVAPSPELISGVRAGIFDSGREGAPRLIVALNRRVRIWRAIAAGTGTLAAALVLGILVHDAQPQAPRNLVAVLQHEAGPAFLVSVDIDRRSLTIRPVAARAPEGKAYELWLIEASLGAPRSLGVVDAERASRPSLASYGDSVVEQGTYAITLESAGGSKDGKPSGAPVFSGRLVSVEP